MTLPGLPTLGDAIFQLGYVFPDLEAQVAHMTNVMGSPGFLRLDSADIADQTYLGAPIECAQNLAFGFVGPFNIELIQPTAGVNIYTTFLDERPAGGLHHIGCLVSDFEKAVAELEDAGFPIAQTGRFGEGTRFAYADTRPVLGHYTEVLLFDEATIALFDDLRAGRL